MKSPTKILALLVVFTQLCVGLAEAAQDFSIEISSTTGGQVTGPAGVAAGEDAAFTITAAEAYVIDRVYVNDVAVGRVASYTFTNVMADQSIHAKFVRESADTGGFPREMYFRTPWRFVNRSEAEYDAEHERLDGIISKCFKEELTQNDDVQERYQMNRFAEKYPGKQVICHFNGLGRNPEFEREPFFSGHWRYKNWTDLEQDIDSSTTTLKVADSSKFTMARGRAEGRPDNLIIVPVDENDNKLWDEAEHVLLTAIVDSTTIEVQRGQWNTTARAFSASRTLVANHEVNGPWSTGPSLWIYNLSDNSPRDENGKNCADVLSDQIASWFEEGGYLEHFTGIQFDIAKQVSGIERFYQKLRSKVGDDILLLADGGVDNSQRVTQYMSGMEAEGWCGPHIHDYTKWSNALNYFDYWERFSEQTPTLNYTVHKADGDYSVLADRQRARLDFAAATAIGIAYATTLRPDDALEPRAPKYPSGHLEVWDETLGGDLQQAHWLGQPVGPLRHVAKTTPDQLSGHGVSISDDFIASWSSTSGSTTFSREAGTPNALKITAAGDATYNNFTHPGGDLTLFVDARMSGNAHLPKPLSATIGNVTLRGYVGTLGDAPICFYFRDIPAGDIDITFECAASINLFMKDFTIHNSPAALAREFQHGVVLANPSTQATNFALDALFPNWSFSRLNGTQTNSIGDGNDGSRVGTSISSAPENGIFLRKVTYTAPVETTYRPDLDFDSVQGKNQWRYYEYEGGVYSELNWDADDGYWQGSETWIRIWEDSCHPANKEVVRVWEAPLTGEVSIQGAVRKVNITGGNGVVATLRHNGEVIWGPQVIAFDDGVGFSYDLSRNVLKGDHVYFHLNDNGNFIKDATSWGATITFTPDPDADNDGMDDPWEVLTFGGTDMPEGSASDDADGDGMNNLGEYVAGTDPQDVNSLFYISTIEGPAPNGDVELAFPSVAGRIYDIEMSLDLLSRNWTPVATNISATPPQNTVTVNAQQDAVFYRVTARR
ncbi:MAG: hypothetical protein ACPGN3_12980 [Opitutales bacterium]